MTNFYLAGQIPTAGSFGEYDTYEAQLLAATTNPTLGDNAESQAWFTRLLPGLVTCGGFIRFGTSGVNAGSGAYRITLPIPADTTLVTANNTVALAYNGGSALLRDNSAVSASRIAVALLSGEGDRIWFRHENTSGSSTTSDSSPWTWAAEDAIGWNFTYPIVPGT